MNVFTKVKPRRWQQEALKRWARDLRGVARVVTGGGKTVFAYLCIGEFLERFPDGRVVIVVPTIALLDQWFVDICDSMDVPEEQIACYSGESQPDYPGTINILVLNTARRAGPEISEGTDKPTILIVDECHRAGSPQNALALHGNYRATLGLSATPERESDEGFEERIVPALGPIFYEYEYSEARRDGVIVDFNLINIEIDANSEDLIQRSAIAHQLDELARRASPDSDPNKIKKKLYKRAAISAQAALRVPWAVKLTRAHYGERIVIFHERVESLKRIVTLLAEDGQNAVAYHSNLSESHRRDNLRLFRRGIVNVLVTCRALDEGTNVPEANVAVVARSTSSTRQRIQRLGRVLRPASGKKFATVYTLYAGEEERERLSIEAQGLEGVASIIWKRGAVQ